MPLNLEQHRGLSDVWDPANQPAEWDVERWLIAAASGACVATGVRARSVAGLLLVIGGGLLAWWATHSAEDRRQQLGRLRAIWPLRERLDTVVEASEESFPASDAPSWTSTAGNPGNGHTPDAARWR